MPMKVVKTSKKPQPPLAKDDATSLSPRQSQLILAAQEIEREDAETAGALGYMNSVFAQVTLPHTNPHVDNYRRTNGQLRLLVRAHPDFGMPFGTLPRILMGWICTEAKIKQKDGPTLILGRSAAEFSRKLDLAYNGRDLARLKQQTMALSRAIISVDGLPAKKNGEPWADIQIVRKGFMFWDNKNLEQPGLWNTTITLNSDFFELIKDRSFPIDIRVYHALSKSPMAMDIYTWLSYRMFTLARSGRSEVLIPWGGMQAQFGAGYADTPQGLRHFKSRFRTRLKEVLAFYIAAQGCIEDAGEHLRLMPAATHISGRGRDVRRISSPSSKADRP